jgi:hypothetical protein
LKQSFNVSRNWGWQGLSERVRSIASEPLATKASQLGVQKWRAAMDFSAKRPAEYTLKLLK